MAFVLDEAALTGLAATAPQGGLEIVIPLPVDATGTPFNHNVNLFR